MIFWTFVKVLIKQTSKKCQYYIIYSQKNFFFLKQENKVFLVASKSEKAQDSRCLPEDTILIQHVLNEYEFVLNANRILTSESSQNKQETWRSSHLGWSLASFYQNLAGSP